jgi:general secretion pathway protein I
MIRAPRQSGYTLIEVLVAFAILALALTLLLGTLTNATRQVRWAGDASRAALHAESLLAETGVGEPLREGRTEGQFEGGRYRWTMEIAPWQDPEAPPSVQPVDPGAPMLYALDLDVRWGDGSARDRLQLQSLRLVTPSPTGAPP